MDFIIPQYNPSQTYNNLSRVLEFILDPNPNATYDDCSSGNLTTPYGAYRLFRVIVDVCVVSVICLLGFLGNSLTIVILWSDQDKKSTTNWLLQTLAVVDIVYLVACLFIQPLKTIRDITDWLHPRFRHLFTQFQPYIWALASMAQMVTVWTVLLVTIDRYIAICYPLKTKIRTLENARIALVVVVLLAVVYNIPLMLENGVSVDETVDPCGNLHHSPSLARLTRHSVLYFLVYKTVCFVVFRSVGPLVALLTLNVKLVKALSEMRRRHRYLSSSSRQRENVTLTLVVVVSVFIVCDLPDVCLRLAVTSWELNPAMQLDVDVTHGLVNPVTNMLLTVNSSVNFLIYCLIGKKFRRILFRLCLRRGARLPETRVSTSQMPTARTYEMTEVYKV